MLKFLDRFQPLGLLVLRLVLGVVMVAHGYPKVFGGLPKHVGLVASLGLPGWLGYFSAGAEFLGGILVMAGLLTRVASLFILIDMAVAVWKVHWSHGLKGPGGYEFPLSLAAIALALIFYSAGPLSLDWVFSRGGGKGGGKK